jgi:hypothetical protein
MGSVPRQRFVSRFSGSVSPAWSRHASGVPLGFGLASACVVVEPLSVDDESVDAHALSASAEIASPDPMTLFTVRNAPSSYCIRARAPLYPPALPRRQPPVAERRTRRDKRLTAQYASALRRCTPRARSPALDPATAESPLAGGDVPASLDRVLTACGPLTGDYSDNSTCARRKVRLVPTKSPTRTTRPSSRSRRTASSGYCTPSRSRSAPIPTIAG